MDSLRSPRARFGLMEFDLKHHLPTYTPAQAAPFFLLSLAASWTVCFLAHSQSDTRLLRTALWPVAVAANLWAVLTVDMRGTDLTWNIVGLLLFNATSAAVRWGCSTTPPQYHPSPRLQAYPALRGSNAFKGLDLLLNEARLISVVGASQPLQPARHGRYYHTARHFLNFLVSYVLIDIISYPLYHLDPSNLGNPMSYSANWSTAVTDISGKLGLPEMAVTALLTLQGAVQTFLGMAMVWHLAAMFGIGSGIWVPEEWPKFMDAPWKSTSMNELWGRRYHQMLRNGFHTYSRPLAFLPKHFSLLRIFLASAVYHMLCYHPHHQKYNVRNNCLMFLLSGSALEGERQFYRWTGRRVGGWPGRIWTWLCFICCGYFIVRYQAEMGWLGGFRQNFEEDRRISLVEWILYLAGARPHPSMPLSGAVSDSRTQ